MSDQKSRILECACELYLTEGYDGFSMRELARRLGFTAPALYRHYGSREELLIDVIIEGYRTQVHYLYAGLSGTDPLDRMTRAGMGYLEFALDHPRYYGMLYAWADFMGIDELPEAMAEQIASVKQFWCDRVRECVSTEMVREGDCLEISHTLWSHAHGLISLYLRGVTPMGADDFREIYARSFLRIFVGLAGARVREELSRDLVELEAHSTRPLTDQV